MERIRKWLQRWVWRDEINELNGRLATCHARMREMYWSEKAKEAASAEIARFRVALEAIRQDGIDNPGTQRAEVFAAVDRALSHAIPAGPYFDWLQPFDGPVVEGLEGREVVYAKDQPEYLPLRTLRSPTKDAKVLSRWTFTPAQRMAVAGGADVMLALMTFGNPLQPILVGVAKDPNPEFIEGILDGGVLQ